MSRSRASGTEEIGLVRLSALSEGEREHIMSKPLPHYRSHPFVAGPDLADRRVALVTTAGLHARDDKTFELVDTSYRVISGDVDLDTLTMSHSSVHFDRTAFHEDVNTVFPLDRLRDLEADGEIGSVAAHHYSLMGAGWPPERIEATALELARLLRLDRVDAVCLIPV